ncbi:MAG: hybrid sensor histidine kinase/response regulator [Betaproteobacteria bacterium]
MNLSDNILIVDDNPSNLQVLGSMLQTGGYKVRPALTGELALRAIAAEKPDLILLDICMPGMDGYEVCKRIKAAEDLKDIPVIFISALNEIEDKLSAFHAGGVDYITKPFQLDEVLARVRTQMELSRTRASLAASNAQLRELMEQLVQSEKLKSLGSLAAGVAHELNTPVGNSLLMADTIHTLVHEFAAAKASGAPGPEIDEFLAHCLEGSALILRNLDRASRLINSLKEVSVDRASERRRLIHLRNTVADVVALLGSMINKTSHAVIIDIDPDLVLETYPGHLEQILDNLIQNAIIHGFAGTPSGTIRVSAQRVTDERITLLVADNGQGIAPENLNRVFDPFYTTRLGQGGSGLGLHIAYTLACGILGGNLSVSSPPGGGTQFTLTLPQSGPSAGASANAGSSA